MKDRAEGIERCRGENGIKEERWRGKWKKEEGR